MTLHAGERGARVPLYAGQPLSEPLVQRGPFVAGSTDELSTQYREYRDGLFPRLSQLQP